MATALNETHFLQPHWRVIAAGFDTESWFEDGLGTGTGGILRPEPTSLAQGQYLYRFASSSSPRHAQLGGGWWIDYENFASLRSFAERGGYSIRDAARLTLALPYSWTRVDLLIRALLIVRLKAYTGAGKPAQGSDKGADQGTKWIPTQHRPIRQLYIPGLYVKGEKPREQLFEVAFRWPGEITRLV